MDYIDMLLIQEDPEDENDDAALPSSLSLSPQKCQVQHHRTLPNLHLHPPQPQTRAYLEHQLQVGPHLSGHGQQHLWQGQVNQCLSGANVDIAAECRRRLRTDAVILETVSHLAHGFASYAWTLIIYN